jgi:hypothetical protein
MRKEKGTSGYVLGRVPNDGVWSGVAIARIFSPMDLGMAAERCSSPR